jgi:hypothetical protein
LLSCSWLHCCKCVRCVAFSQEELKAQFEKEKAAKKEKAQAEEAGAIFVVVVRL